MEFTIEDVKSDIIIRNGILLFHQSDDFRLTLEMLQERYAWISDEYINDTVQHETEHIEFAKKVFGDKHKMFFGIRILDMETGKIGIYPFYVSFKSSPLLEEPTLQERADITNAPTIKSPGDKTVLTEIDIRVADGQR